MHRRCIEEEMLRTETKTWLFERKYICKIQVHLLSRASRADGTMAVLYTSQYHFYMFWIDKTTHDCLVIVLSVRCLKKQWTLSICFGEIIVGHAVQTSLNLVTLLMLAATSVCGLLHFEETQTHVLYDKLWYCIFGLCFFFFLLPSGHLIFEWLTLLCGGHLFILRCALAKSSCRLMSRQTVGYEDAECARPSEVPEFCGHFRPLPRCQVQRKWQLTHKLNLQSDLWESALEKFWILVVMQSGDGILVTFWDLNLVLI